MTGNNIPIEAAETFRNRRGGGVGSRRELFGFWSVAIKIFNGVTLYLQGFSRNENFPIQNPDPYQNDKGLATLALG